MATRLTPVAIDIETTGLECDAEVTVIGLVVPLGCRVLFQTGGRQVAVDDLERTLESAFETTIRLSAHRTERDLLEAFGAFLATSVSPNEYMIVAYNGERYRGGFDLPFLRTRHARLDRSWPFEDLPYADLLPIFERRFNTAADGADSSDLETVYETLVGGVLTDRDPFDDSVAAVEAFDDGEFEPLLAHNLADILRTDALASVAQAYCATSEFDLKSLTPTIRDPNLRS